MAPSPKGASKRTRKGSRHATSVIFHTGKYLLMTPADVRKITKSAGYHGHFLLCCREDPKNMMALMKLGMEACREGEEDTAQTKKERKREAETRFAASNKRQRCAERQAQGFGSFKQCARNTGLEYRSDAQATIISSAADPLPITSASKGTIEEVQTGTVAIEARKLINDGKVAQDEETDEDEDAVDDEDNRDGATGEGVKACGNIEAFEDAEASEDEETSEDEESPEDDDDIKMELEPAKDKRQQALVWGEPLPVDDRHCRSTLAAIFTSSRRLDVDAEIKMLNDKCIEMLDPDRVQGLTIKFLKNRLEEPTAGQPPIALASSSVEEIFEVLNTLTKISEDTSIRRVSTQIMLFLSIQHHVISGSEDTSDGRVRAHLAFLKNVATARAGNVSNRESKRIYDLYERDYYAGKNWLEVVNMFDHDAIIILIIVAKIGPTWIATRFTMYQRACLRHIAKHLYGIHNLVTALGPKALERYCQHGCLDKETVDRVEDAQIF